MSAGCGDDGRGAAPSPTAPTARLAASVTITADAPALLVGQQVQTLVVVKDADGVALTSRPAVWSSSDEHVAAVSPTGRITALAPGVATLTVVVDGRSASMTVEVIDGRRIPAFVRPFPRPLTPVTISFHDHDEPLAFADRNGRYIPYWGEPSAITLRVHDGHFGYDWALPRGTPVLAVADGEVTTAATTTPAFFCPLTNANVETVGDVRIDHALPAGVRVRSVYLHLSRVDVRPGEKVTAGQQIGLSGGAAFGCALGDLLEFGVLRLTQTNGGAPSPIDPYGWSGPGADPWTRNPAGAESIWLWQDGEEVPLFRGVALPFGETLGPFVQMTYVRFQGVRDELAPNNELVEVSRDPRAPAAPLDLSGFAITTLSGATYRFPVGLVLSAERPTVRVHVGAGADGGDDLYWGRASGALDDLRECVRLYNAVGVLRNQAGWGGGCA